MKPDWKDAPEWANWLAMDSDGSWWWHESKPYLVNEYSEEWRSGFRFKEAAEPPRWREEIEQRP